MTPPAGGLIRTLLDSAPYIVLVVEAATGRVIDANPGAALALGYSQAELRALDVFAFDVGLSRERFARRVVAPGERVPFESCYRRKDGKTFPVEVQVDGVVDGSGRAICLAIARDISGQRAVAAELEEARQGYEFLARGMPGVVYRFVLGAAPGLAWVDERVRELSGYTPAELAGMGRGVLRLILPEDRRRVFRAVRAVRAPTGRVYDHHYRVRTKDGEVRTLHDTGRCLAGPAGGPVRAEGMLLDVTERVESERVLREAWEAEHERFHLVVRASRQITHEWRASTNSISWGGSLRDVLGYDRAEHGETFEHWLMRVHPEDRPALRERRRRAGVDQETMLDFEYRYLHADGSYRWFWDHVAFEWGPDGRLVHSIGVMQDVTARKQLEAQVHSAQRMETIGALAGGVAHDVNNYLTTILGNIDLARMRLEGGERWEELEDARAAVQGCAELVRSLLTFARQRQPARTMLLATEVVANAGRILQRLVGANVELCHEADPGLTLFADPVQVQQVLMNLVANAREALDDAGRITIRIEPVERPDPVAGIRQPYARLTVADNGPGVPPALLDRIFEPYFSTRPLGEGTGLGLSIVHGIARAHGGWVEVENPPGGGAAFSVYFPTA